MSRKHHHVVSEGYQRLFANADGIRLIDKSSEATKVVGTKSAFARQNFCSYLRDGQWSDELEDEWARRESYALPHARRLIEGARDREGRDALKVLAAIHYARGYAFDVIIRRLIAQEGEDAPRRVAQLEHMQTAFEADYGRSARPGEIEAIVMERWREHFEAGTFVVAEMASGFNKTMEILGPLSVQLVWPRTRTVDFIFGDIPLVHRSNDGRLSALGGLALGDASEMFFPVGPRLAALFTSRPTPDVPVSDDQVQLLNGRSWRAAVRFLGAHPETNAKRSLLRWGLVDDRQRRQASTP